ncbi:MAG: phosphatase PAP2 family protein, partial [Bacteroidales bacterium]
CFTGLVFRKRWYSIFICCWAFLVSYSRIYVGKHFPLDVICGILLGAVTGWLVYLLYKKIITRYISSRPCAAS